jgi:hypothetical protein
LEDSIVSMIEDIKKIHNFEKEAVSCLDDMEKRISRSVQAIEMMRKSLLNVFPFVSTSRTIGVPNC